MAIMPVAADIISNASSTMENQFAYHAFGKARIKNTSANLNEQRQYIGQEYDQTTDLNYHHARYYNSTRGQFLSEDPAFTSEPARFLSDPQQMNAYSYARNNPIALKDPAGDASMSAWATNPVGTVGYVAFLGSVAIIGAQFRGLPATAELLSHSLSLNPGPINAGNGSVLTQAITSSKQYQESLQDKLREASSEGRKSITGVKLPLKFTEGDAFSAFHKIDLTVNATKDKDGAWQVSTQGSDVYDFQQMNYDNKFVGTINNAAYFAQNAGAVSNFTTNLNFTLTVPLSQQTFTTPSGAVVTWDGHVVSDPGRK
jgi:RHS repeat-associated protein